MAGLIGPSRFVSAADVREAAASPRHDDIDTMPNSAPSITPTSKASACSCASTSTCRWRTARSPTPRASSASRRPSREIADKGGKVILLAHFGRPKGRDPKESLKPVAAAVAHVIEPARSPSPTTASATAAEEAVARDEARRHPLSGEHALPQGRREERSGLRRSSSPSSATSMSTMPSRRRTARMPRPRARATSCRPMPAAPCRPSWKRSARRWKRRQRPVVAIVGGAKVSTKLDLLENLITKVDALVIGGAMANTFLPRRASSVGKSLAEHDLADTARAHPGQGRGRQAARSSCRSTRSWRIHFEANAPSHAYGLDAIPARRHDPRYRPAVDRAHQGRARRRRDAGLERPARRVRDAAVRPRHRRRSPSMRPSAPRPASSSRSPAAAIRSRR